MKGVVVREMASLVLRPSRSPAKDTKPAPGKGKGKEEKDTKRDLQQDHSKYYAIIACNQIVLSPTQADRDVAIQLINLYFELFKEILGQKESPTTSEDAVVDVDFDHVKAGTASKLKGRGKSKDKGKGKADDFTEVEDGDSRLISAILTGVNRALPFAKLGIENVEYAFFVVFLMLHLTMFLSDSPNTLTPFSLSLINQHSTFHFKLCG